MLAPYQLRLDFLYRVVDAWRAAGHPQVQISSYVRTPARNAAVGGSRFSQHLLGLAIDFVGNTSHPFPRELRRQGLVAVDEGDHLHVQYLRAGLAAEAGLFSIDV